MNRTFPMGLRYQRRGRRRPIIMFISTCCRIMCFVEMKMICKCSGMINDWFFVAIYCETFISFRVCGVKVSHPEGMIASLTNDMLRRACIHDEYEQESMIKS